MAFLYTLILFFTNSQKIRTEDAKVICIAVTQVQRL